MKRLIPLLLIIIFIGGFLVRLYRFDNPVADWHAFRQSDTNAVSSIFAQNGINLLSPKYYDISNVQSGKDNFQGYRFVEFPIYNALQVLGFKIFGKFSLVEWGRLIAIFFSLSSALFIYLLVKKYFDSVAAVFGAFFFLFLPFSIFFSRTILPDTAMAASILGGIYFFDKWLEGKSKITNLVFFGLSILFTEGSFLLKPFALFFTLPMFYLVFKKFGIKSVIKWQLWLFLILSVAPLVLWRLWISQHPEGIPVSDWLFNKGNIRFTGAFFYWIFAERISKLILGYFGIFFLLFGILKKEGEKDYLFFLSFLASSLLYLTIIARGNVQHDYYQILIIPTIAIFLGRGVSSLLSAKSFGSKQVNLGITAVVIVSMLAFSWYYVRDYFNINDWKMVQAAAAANKVLPKDTLIIAPYDDSTTFLNLIQRRGWPVFEKSPEELIKMGAKYLVLANPTQNDINGFGKTYKIFSSSSAVLILKLK